MMNGCCFETVANSVIIPRGLCVLFFVSKQTQRIIQVKMSQLLITIMMPTERRQIAD